jgi:hypothetical protein
LTDVLNVYVPARPSHLNGVIRPGSGIVGAADPETGRVVIDYEGNLHGAANLTTWEACVRHAAGSHRVRYPTVARTMVAEAELVKVGELDGDEILVTDKDLVDEWRRT